MVPGSPDSFPRTGSSSWAVFCLWSRGPLRAPRGRKRPNTTGRFRFFTTQGFEGRSAPGTTSLGTTGHTMTHEVGRAAAGVAVRGRSRHLLAVRRATGRGARGTCSDDLRPRHPRVVKKSLQSKRMISTHDKDSRALDGHVGIGRGCRTYGCKAKPKDARTPLKTAHPYEI